MTEITADEPARDGFTGSVSAFLEWLEDRLVYGGVLVSKPMPAEIDHKKLVRRVELITAGYSDDERLLGRIEQDSMFALMFWSSTHRGGLVVYEVPIEHYSSSEEITWLRPASDVFEEIHRAREVIVRTPQEDEFSIAVPHGAQLSYSEPERDINEPAGVLVIEPVQDHR